MICLAIKTIPVPVSVTRANPLDTLTGRVLSGHQKSVIIPLSLVDVCPCVLALNFAGPFLRLEYSTADILPVLVCVSIALEAGRLRGTVAMLPALEQEYELRKCNRRIPLQDCYLQIQQEAAGLLASMAMQFNKQSGTSTSMPSTLMCREFSVAESEYAPQRRNHFETFQRLWKEEQADLAAYARRHQESTLERVGRVLVVADDMPN